MADIMSKARKDFIEVAEELLELPQSSFKIELDMRSYNTTIYVEPSAPGLRPDIREAMIKGDVDRAAFWLLRTHHTNKPTMCEQQVLLYRKPMRSYEGFSVPINVLNIWCGKWNKDVEDVVWRYTFSIRLVDRNILIPIPKQDRHAMEVCFAAFYEDRVVPDKGRIKRNFARHIERIIDACNRYAEWKKDEARYERLYVSAVKAIHRGGYNLSNYSFPQSIMDLPEVERIIAKMISKELSTT